MTFEQKTKEFQKIINNWLDSYLAVEDVPEKIIVEAMRYSLINSGKRLRPVLSLAVSEILGGDYNEVLPYACAIEMIHTYSLIHDDLPAMDNDDFRRGIPTNHKVYGDAIAVLAGDSLLNEAFLIMIDSAKGENIQKKLEAAAYISKASGMKGMIAGQVIDICSEGKSISKELLDYMHRCKTGALIKASILAPAIINNICKDKFAALNTYAEAIGLAFQIKDDILDVESTTDELGKPVGSDAENNKSTYVTLCGIIESKKLLSNLVEKAINSLQCFDERALFLREMARYIAERKK